MPGKRREKRWALVWGVVLRAWGLKLLGIISQCILSLSNWYIFPLDVCENLGDDDEHLHLFPLMMFQINRLHAAWYCVSLLNNPFFVKLCLMLSIHITFNLPLPLFSGKSSTIIILPIYPSSLLVTS